MWYLKKIETMPDYENFKSGNGNTDFIEPNVSYIINDDKVNFNSYVPKKTVYVDGKKYEVEQGTTWKDFLQTIPELFQYCACV